MHRLIFTALLIGSISIFGTQSSQLAPLTSEQVLIGAATSQGIRFYAVDAEKSIQLVGQLPSNFAVENLEQGEWIISSTSNFAVANDSNRIAFTAQRNDEVGLFIYDIETNTLQEQPIPYMSRAEWSPNDRAILLEPRVPAAPASVYEIESDQFISLPNTEGFAGGFQWLPDGARIIYVAVANACAHPCLATDVYITNYITQEPFALTEMGSRTASSSSYICGPTWNQYDERAYYVVGCNSAGNPLIDEVYSVDLDGQTRLETTFSNIFPDRFVSINGIHVSSNGVVYVAAIVTNWAGTETHWIVAKISNPEPPQILSETAFDGYKSLYRSRLSPGGNYLALNGYYAQPDGGDLVAIDLSNGQTLVGENAVEAACEIQWLDNERLLFGQVEGWCFPPRAIGSYEAFYEINVLTGEISPITTSLDGQFWLLRTTKDN